MVKDILRSLKSNLGQFIAITLIIALGVGFYVGIQVTGYDMRDTISTYMSETHAFDYALMATQGVDKAMLEDLKAFQPEAIFSGVHQGDVIVSRTSSEDVFKFYQLNDATEHDLTIIEGRKASGDNEVVIDYQAAERHQINIGDTLNIKAGTVFKGSDVKVVGLVRSNQFVNVNRGNTVLGTGVVTGYIYGHLPLKTDDIYTTVRIHGAVSKETLETLPSSILEERRTRALQSAVDALQEAQQTLDQSIEDAEQAFQDSKRQLDQSYHELQQAQGALIDGYKTIAPGVEGNDILVIQKQAQDHLTHQKVKTITQLDEAIRQNEEPIKSQLLKEKEQALLQFSNAQAGLDALGEKVQDVQIGLAKVNEGYDTYHTEYQAYQQEIARAQKEIDSQKETIEKTEVGEVFVLDRDDAIVGYRDFYEDSHRVESIGKVFPLIFFGVALLVTLSTMSRMVEDARTEMGIYKALGYTPFQTALKFIVFASLAWGLGVILGLVIGFYALPLFIYNAYRIMYQTPDMSPRIVWSYAWFPIVLSFVTSVGVAWVQARRRSALATAVLLRPQAPKQGSRVFLERIPFIWNRLSFLYKVSLRNLFRNPTRFLMSVIGVGGCLGLLITGFGLDHSISSIVDKQFESIVHYDGMVHYETNKQPDFSKAEASISFESASVTLGHQSVYAYIFESQPALDEFVSLKDVKTQKPLTLSQNGVMISAKLAKLLHVGVGDSLAFTYKDQQMNYNIDGIFENYVMHYLYMTQDVWEAPYEPNAAFFNGDIKQDLISQKGVQNVSMTDEMHQSFKDQMGNFDTVIIIIAGAAILLEVIVLVNLIRMNLGERMKEMATLKVLGFYPKELSTYLLRENLFMVGFAFLFGLVFGSVLHFYVIQTAETSLVMFNRELLWQSQVLAMALTLFVLWVVSLRMSRKVNAVNMSEALKTFDA